MKRTKKFLVGLLSLAIMLVFPLSLTACDKECKEHTWGEWTETTPATCTQKGTKTHKCSKCSKEESEEIDALGHSYGEVTYVWAEDNSTCTASRVCLRDAGHVESETVTAHYVGNLPTCEESASGHNVVEFENEVFETQEIEVTLNALGHDMVKDEENSQAATCLVNGHDHMVCQREGCDHSYDVVTTGEHSWNGVRSCTEGRTCSVCDAFEPAYGHDMHIDEAASRPATCETDGEEVYVCHREGCVYHYSVVATHKGHMIDGVEPTIEPVENQKCTFVYVYACSVCGEAVRGETFVKHTYVASIKTPATCESEGIKTYTCSVCGDNYDATYASDKNAHNWIEDENNPGHYHCEYCSETKVVLDNDNHTEATIPSGSITGASEIVLADVAITLNENTLANANGNVVLSVNKLVGEERNPVLGTLESDNKLLQMIGNSPIYNFNMVDSTSNNVVFTESPVTIAIDYTLGEGEDVDSIYVWYINNDGEIENIQATYNAGKVYFTTNHFSYYVIVRLTPDTICQYEGHNYKEVVVEATCTEDGYTLKVCSRCGHTEKTDIVEAKGHTPVKDVENSTEPTCTEDGLYTYVCHCGYSYTQTMPMTGHNYVLDTKNSTEATCTAVGTKVYVCEGCHDSYNVTEPMLEHTYEITQTIPASCEEAGYNIHTCSACGDSYKEEIKALSHNFDEGVHYDHTQTEKGYTAYTCSLCGKRRLVYDDTVEHTYGESVYHDHTENESGYYLSVCTICGKEQKVHDASTIHVNDKGVHTEHTQTENGYTTYTCVICGRTEIIPDKEVVHTPNIEHATCKDDQVCTVCGLIMEDHHTVEHTIVNGLCTVCGYGCKHDLGNETIETIEATCEEAGCRYYICDNCGVKVVLEEFEALGHDGDLICRRCGKETVSVEYFDKLFTNMMNTKYTLSINDAEVVSLNKYNETISETNIKFAELYIGKDANGVYAFGNSVVTTKQTDSNTGVNATTSINSYTVLRDGYAYIKTNLDNGHVSVDSYYGSVDAVATKGNTLYIKLNISTLIDFATQSATNGQAPSGMITMQMIEQVQNWYETSFAPYLNNIVNLNKESWLGAVRLFANDLFSLEEVDGSYIFKIDTKSVSRLIRDITNLSVQEFIDVRLGENTFENIENTVLNMLVSGKTVGDIMDYLKTRGLDLYKLVDLLDILSKEVTGMPLDDLVAGMINSTSPMDGEGMEFSIKKTLDAYSAMELRQLIILMIGEENTEALQMAQTYLYPNLEVTTVEQAVSVVKAFVDEQIDPYVRDMKVFDVIYLVVNAIQNSQKHPNNPSIDYHESSSLTLAGDESNYEAIREQMIENIMGVVQMLDQLIDVNFVATADGYITSITYSVISDENSRTNITLNLTQGEVLNSDYSTIISDVNTAVSATELTKDNLGVLTSELGFKVGLNDNGELETLTKTLSTEELSKIQNVTSYEYKMGADYRYEYTIKAVSVSYYLLGNQVCVENACNDLYYVSNVYKMVSTFYYDQKTYVNYKIYNPDGVYDPDNGYDYRDEYGYFKYKGYEFLSDSTTHTNFESYSGDLYYIFNTKTNTVVEASHSIYFEHNGIYNGIYNVQTENFHYSADETHEFKLVSSTISDTCEGISIYHYVCSVCGKEKTTQHVEGHRYENNKICSC